MSKHWMQSIAIFFKIFLRLYIRFLSFKPVPALSQSVVWFLIISFVVQCCSCCNVLRLFADFCQNYTLRYRVSDGRYSNVTKVVIYITSSNMYPPRFSVPVYTVTGITEKDQSAVNSLLTTVSHTHLCIYCLYGSVTMLLAGLTSLSVWSGMVYYYFLKSCISSLHLVAEECVYFSWKNLYFCWIEFSFMGALLCWPLSSWFTPVSTGDISSIYTSLALQHLPNITGTSSTL